MLRTGDELESLALHFNDMVQGLKERDHLKETFGRYLTRQVADHLMSGEQHLGGLKLLCQAHKNPMTPNPFGWNGSPRQEQWRSSV